METELKLLFPTLMRYKPNETKFVGIFKTKNNENVFASFNVPNYPAASGITFETGININETMYQFLISKSDNINFLEFLKLFTQVVVSAAKQRIFNRKFFSLFVHEFRDLRQKFFKNEKFIFDDKNETLTIIHIDEFSAENKIVIKMNFYEEGPQLYEVIKHTFPSTNNFKLFHDQCSLYVLHKQFLNYIKNLGTFHYAMHKIDSVCWVIAPPKPTYEHDYRTIIIGENNISMKVTFNPWKMSEIPDFKFFGPSDLIQQFKDNLSENLSNWDAECDIIQNILKVLDLPFFPVRTPSSSEPSAEMYDAASNCCLCFFYHMQDEAPNVHCENSSCSRFFHQECLYEWLSRLPSNSVYFGSVVGPCPNCEKTISCKVPEK